MSPTGASGFGVTALEDPHEAVGERRRTVSASNRSVA